MWVPSCYNNIHTSISKHRDLQLSRVFPFVWIVDCFFCFLLHSPWSPQVTWRNTKRAQRGWTFMEVDLTFRFFFGFHCEVSAENSWLWFLKHIKLKIRLQAEVYCNLSKPKCPLDVIAYYIPVVVVHVGIAIRKKCEKRRNLTSPECCLVHLNGRDRKRDL